MRKAAACLAPDIVSGYRTDSRFLTFVSTGLVKKAFGYGIVYYKGEV